ncbi:hypothetical protein [Maritimibacter sp. DP1N21-5]|uniref:hypothetical protein n=1 Tax=Maritimibacter sp. DP1N21-5 TaxID=2836867 RepID=UPI001C47D196|nr:hypothetical protein [Maritimibacter sp. DP1N21-5]MBV7410443.1 hypothetical protein [Maritimibacter sp. DP1N21-5]
MTRAACGTPPQGLIPPGHAPFPVKPRNPQMKGGFPSLRPKSEMLLRPLQNMQKNEHLISVNIALRELSQ